ncbi:NAD(P)-dependent glycerol-1-phosphate dehydrogenase [[Eubacterium] cellulosolvens]
MATKGTKNRAKPEGRAQTKKSTNNGRRHNGEKSKSMELPRRVAIGHGQLESVGEICKSLHLRGLAIIVVDENTKRIAGNRTKKILARSNYEATIVVITDADMKNLEKVKEVITEQKGKFVLGVGGGRPIDIAKLASFETEKPFLSIPTVASHDGIVSSQASIMVDNTKQSINTHTPFAVIADTKIISESPYKLLASGAGDIISNFSAVKDWTLAKKLRNEYFSSSAAMLSEISAKMILEDAETISNGDEESAWLVAKALVSSGVAMSIAGSSRPASGSEHMFSHALDRLAPKPALHGEQCALGTIMMMYLHGGNWEEIRESLAKIRVPITAKALKIDDDLVIEALTIAHTIKPDRYTILSGGLTYDAAEDLAVQTGVIS